VVTHSKEVANSADIILELRDRKLKKIHRITQEVK
jgi:putative ABC transport system ATP-binding protein